MYGLRQDLRHCEQYKDKQYEIQFFDADGQLVETTEGPTFIFIAENLEVAWYAARYLCFLPALTDTSITKGAVATAKFRLVGTVRWHDNVPNG